MHHTFETDEPHILDVVLKDGAVAFQHNGIDLGVRVREMSDPVHRAAVHDLVQYGVDVVLQARDGGGGTALSLFLITGDEERALAAADAMAADFATFRTEDGEQEYGVVLNWRCEGVQCTASHHVQILEEAFREPTTRIWN